MDIPDITLREIVQSSSESNTEPNSMKDGHKTSKRWFGLDTSKSAVGIKILEKWNVIFVISCLFAVLTDTLFLYIPLINQDVKCIRLDKNLKIAAVLFRSITDFVYIVKIIFQIYELKKVTVTAILRSYILLDILAILPIPQVIILIYFTKMRGSGSLNTRKFLNLFLVLIQYVPRILRIYLACKEIKNPPDGKLGLWIKGGLNFLMYIFAGHIFGGFWYFFSVQRMMDCWQYACRDEDGCKPSTFNCQEHPTSNIIKLLNDSCPISPSNATVFDFGIFLNALQSGLVGQTDYSRKFSNCFWWGLRNLSSLGSNLQPSTNTWENLFAAFTSITGLLLFLYLLGKLQMYMQVESASKEQLRWTTELENVMRTERKIRVERSKGPEVEQWLAQNRLPKRFLTEIMETVVQADVEHNREVNVEKLLSILPLHLQEEISLFKKKLEEEVEMWLSENRLPMRLKSEIIEAVARRPEFEPNGIVDVNNVLTMLPPQLRSYIESYQKKLEQEGARIELWLSENRLPMRLKSEIIEAVARRPEFEQNGIVDVNNVLTMLPPQLRSYIESYQKKLEQEGARIELWLSKNRLPMRLKSEIIEAVARRPEFEQNGIVDVNNVLTMLPPQLRSYIESYRQKLREKDEEVDRWLSENELPAESFKPEIMEAVLLNLEEDKEVDVENIFSILPASREESIREYIRPLKIERKMKGVDLCLLKNGIPSSKKSDVKEAVRLELNKDADTDVENFLSTVEWIQEFLPFNRLKKVKLLEMLDEEVLKEICKHLKPVQYEASSYIIQEGQPLELILFVEGTVFFRSNPPLYAPLIWGEELVFWPSSTSFPAEMPIATDTLETGFYFIHGYTNALVLTATDMKSIGSTFRPQVDLLTSLWVTRLKKVPKLQHMDDEVLKAIFLHLKRDLSPSQSYVENQPVVSMYFIIEGSVRFTTKQDDNSEELVRREGEVYGEELLDWVLDTSFPALTPFATHTALYDDDNPAVVLSITAEELKSVASKFTSHFSKFRNESQPDLLTVVGLTVLKRVPKLKTLDEEVLKAISQHLKFKQYDTFVRIIGKGEPVDRMLFLLMGGELYLDGLVDCSTQPADPFFEEELMGGELHKDSFDRRTAGPFFGEELIDWLASSSDATRPLSAYTVITYTSKPRVLFLMANDLEMFKSHFS